MPIGSLIVVALLAFYVVAGYNRLIRLRNLKDEAFATMDVYLKKRSDLVPNLVETVRGYASHEKETLDRVVSARQFASQAQSLEDRASGENLLSGTLKSLFALAEAYPDLKANASFLDLQQQLQSLEGEIAQSRKYYNGVVKEYNTRTEVFPASLIARMFGFVRGTYFEIAEGDREHVQVSF